MLVYMAGKSSQYVNLKTNGKLFPTWVLANFKKYKLPEILFDGSDPCNMPHKSKELRKYQEFLSKYLDFNSPYRDILIYHGLGSGKTRSAINIYNMLYNYSPHWNVFILLKATMRDSIWVKELDSWLQQEEKEFRKKNIEFISYDAPNADKIFLEKVKNADAAKKSLYIIEEVHNFINNVYTNLTNQQGKRALTIYEYIIQEKKDNSDSRVIAISGSPAINSPFELAILFNLLRPNSFPKSEAHFNQLYVSTSAYPIINPATKNTFQRRIMGLVSYYVGSTPEYYAKKNTFSIDVPMSDYQIEIYGHYEQIEERIARRKKISSGNYKSYTRQACNFVFPIMDQGYNGENRPRPRDYKLKDSIIENHLAGRKRGANTEHKSKEVYYKIEEYLEKVQSFINEFDKFLHKSLTQDLENKHTMANDLVKMKELYGNKISVKNFVDYIEKNAPSSLLTVMHMCSAKMTFIMVQLMQSKGSALVYSNYVSMEGLQIFKIYLKYFGFTKYIDKDHGENELRYIEYHGGIDFSERRRVLDIFNASENKYGEICKIILISPAGSEGLSLSNIRQVHIMEPYWHEVRMMQIIGRAIRQCSHKDLPMEERVVDVYRYKSVRPTYAREKQTTDQYIETAARSKEGLIQSFLDAVKEASVDCVLNKNHNDLYSKIQCFQFEEKSLFDTTIGPAFKDDIYDDLKMNNGLNSVNSIVKRIKVIKIKAVILLSHPDEEASYSEPDFYWYYSETLTVYDYDLHYPVGKVGLDNDNFPLKIDQDTFVITHMIPIPILAKN